MDVTFDIDDIKFNYRVAGIIRYKEKILLHKCKTDEFYALPGGKITIGENSKKAIKREVMEEIGKEIKIENLFATVENFFYLKNIKFHEVLIIYNAIIVDELNDVEKIKIIGIEKRGDLEFVWKNIDEIRNLDLRPLCIKEILCDNEVAKDSYIHLINDEINK